MDYIPKHSGGSDMPKEIIEEKYRIITKYLSLIIDEKDFISKEDLILILEALEVKENE